MQMSTVFEVPIPPDRVAVYLGDPRNLAAANHKGPVVERSDGPVATGSWFVLAFGQLRARVEYVQYDPQAIVAKVAITGRGSGGIVATHAFQLSPLDGGKATRVEATIDGTGGLITWEPAMRAAQRLTWRRMRQRMEKTA